MLATLALALALTPAQDLAVRSRTVLQAPDVMVSDARVIVDHPDGGAVVAGSFRRGLQSDMTMDGFVARIGPDGRTVWRTDGRIAGPDLEAFDAAAEGAAGLDDGTLVAAFGDAPTRASVLVRGYGAAGALLWERALPPTSPDLDYALVGALGATDASDALLHFETRQTNGGAGVAVSMRLDGATGDTVWRQDRDIQVETNTPFPVRARVRGGERYFVEYRQDLTHTAHRLDGAGAAIYSTGDVFLGPGSFESRFDVGPTGTAVAVRTGTTSFIDPSGTVVARLDGQSYRQIAMTPAGGALGLQHPLVDAFDASGILLWTPAGRTNAVAIEATPDGGARVYRSFAQALEFLTVTTIDGAGQIVGSSDITLDGERPFSVAPSTVAPDGSQWCAISYGGSAPFEGFTTVVELAQDSGALTAAGAAAVLNSTGNAGRIRLFGDGAASGDDVVLFADRLPPFQTTLFLNSRSTGSMPMLGGGEGTLCLGGSVNRYVGPGELTPATPLGEAWLRLSLPNTPDGSAVSPVLAGETWYYQAWHRDVVGGAQTTNLTDAVAVTYR